MPHVTSIGLDVHARSVAAAAFNPFTGEVVHRDFGTDAAEIAEWALGFEEPRACYESGPTGFHMARELRALGLDCAVAAVSKMQRPAADARRKNDRRDAEFIARMLATHNIVEVPLPDVAVEAARDLDRALDDATRRRCARPRRGEEEGLDEGPLEVGLGDQARGAAARRAGVLRHGRPLRGVGQAAAREEGRRAGGHRPLAGDGGGAVLHQGGRHPDGLQARGGGRVLQQVPLGAGLRELVRTDPVGALERRVRAARRDNQGRQRARAHGAHRVRMALLHVLPEAKGPSPRHRRAPGDTLEGGRLHRQAPPPPRGAGRGGQERVQGQRRRGARARLLGLGDRVQVRGDRPLAAGYNRLPPGGPAPRRIAGASSRPF